MSAGYASAAPKLFRKIDDTLSALEANNDDLHRPIPNSVYSTITFNLGDDVSTDLHYDFLNWIFSWCAIHCLGNHDHRRGGHLILWEWKLVIQFPAGCTIIVPSACVGHGNTPIADGKIRKSVTQYIPGGLMRHEAYGFRTEAKLREENPELWKTMKAAGKLRFDAGVGLFSTVDSLKDDMKKYLRYVD